MRSAKSVSDRTFAWTLDIPPQPTIALFIIIIVNAVNPKISAQCYRVPVSDGHMASVAVKFRKKTQLHINTSSR